jgi:hypothetical protein
MNAAASYLLHLSWLDTNCSNRRCTHNIQQARERGIGRAAVGWQPDSRCGYAKISPSELDKNTIVARGRPRMYTAGECELE